MNLVKDDPQGNRSRFAISQIHILKLQDKSNLGLLFEETDFRLWSLDRPNVRRLPTFSQQRQMQGNKQRTKSQNLGNKDVSQLQLPWIRFS